MTRHPYYSPDDATGTASTTPAATPPPVAAPAAEPERVPLSRLNEVIGERDAARTEAAAAKAARESALVDLAKYSSIESDLAAARARLDLARSGVVDDDHAAALDQVYRGLPEADRPKTAGELWADIASGKRPAPRLLVGFMPAASTTTTTPAPRLPAAASQPAPAAGDVTAADLKSANDRFRANPRDPEAKRAADEVFTRYQAQQKAKRA